MKIHGKEFWQTVASALGDSNEDHEAWVFEESKHNAERLAILRQLNGGPSLYCYLDARNGRYEVKAHEWPSNVCPFSGRKEVCGPTYSEERYVTITFSAAKKPTQAAADINRRFLPGFLAVWSERKVAADDAAEWHAGRRALFDEIHGYLGIGDTPKVGSNVPEESRSFQPDGDGYCTLKAGGKDYVKFNLTLNHELAAQVAVLLGDAMAQRKGAA